MGVERDYTHMLLQIKKKKIPLTLNVLNVNNIDCLKIKLNT